ncbi:MAG: hypothetical protein LBJ15_18215 [Comamonas sp.]|jgi:hypothetical protein|uniref:hypothetical protein n=1 Tax=Comamonas sp. TaxID=34028 RepID=UPI00283A3C5E|nr:hypothetical protein [Comamonas sp.]MDR0215912.1 hypothetical protein [Comamonas sp.]
MALIDEAQRRGLINQIPTSGLTAPAADGSQNNPLNTGLGREVTNTLSAIPGAASVPGAAARGASLVGRAFGTAQAAAPAAQAVAPYAPVVGGGVALASAANAGGPKPPTASPSPSALSSNPLVAAAMAQDGAGDGPTSLSPQPQNQLMPGVYQHGRGQYSDQAGGMGMPSNFTGQPNERNMGAADNLAGRQGLAAYASSPAPERPQNAVPLIEAAGIRHSGNDWAARQNLKNLETSASSITNRPEWNSGAVINRRGQVMSGTADPNGKVAAYQQALATDAALQQAQPSLIQAMLRENAGLQREGMQQAGADRRAQASTSLAMQRLAMDQETQGFANRAAGQTEQLRGVLLDPNATPQQRQSAQQALMTLSGHQPADPYLVVPGGQQIEPNSGKAYTVPASVLNRSTGQFLQQPGQGGATTVSSPEQLSALPSGAVYIGPDGKQYRKN